MQSNENMFGRIATMKFIRPYMTRSDQCENAF